MPKSPRSAAFFSFAILALLGGCAGSNSASHSDGVAEFPKIVIDGDTQEWPADTAAYSDEHYLFLRFTVAEEQFTLQSASKTVALYIDCDANKSTGQILPDPGMGDLGVDLVVLFSPPGPTGAPATGVQMYAVDAAGHRTTLNAADYDLVFAPTYASSWYEVRICRTPDNKAGLPATGLLGPGKLAGVAALLNEQGHIAASSDVFAISTDPVCPGGRKLANIEPPAKPAGALRVVSWNIEKSKPVDNPTCFARILAALAPDVVLMQEWEKGDDALVQKWFETNVPGGQPWHVTKSKGDMTNGGGVVIISHFDLAAFSASDAPLTCTFKNDKGADDTKPVRFIGALVNAPNGPTLVGTTHLKARGTKDSVEDHRRMAEAKAINTAFAAAAVSSGAKYRLISGDLNLVGTRPPLDLLRAGLDADGSDLAPASTPVLGDDAFYTWRDTAEPFTPGRLDWIVYSDSTAQAANQFALDTGRMTDESLAKCHLHRTDSQASDHLPIVVDLLP